MKRVLLGTWSTPSSNSVDVFLSGEGRFRQLALEWDRFPLTPADEVCYVVVILPALTRRVREYLEAPGPAPGGADVTFRAWLQAQRHRNDPIGDLARDVQRDRLRRLTPAKLVRHLIERRGCSGALDARP